MDTPNSSLGVSEDKVASYTPARKRQRTENDKSNAGSNQKEKKKEAPPQSSILSFFKKTKDTASATVTPTKTSAVSSRSPDASSTANFVSPNSIDDDRKPAAATPSPPRRTAGYGAVGDDVEQGARRHAQPTHAGSEEADGLERQLHKDTCKANFSL